MGRFAIAAILFALSTGAAHAACIITPLEDDIAQADTVFVATITRATMDKNPSEMRDKEHYLVRYDFEVVRIIKGDPSIVTALVTSAQFDDPMDDIFWEQAEQSRYVPGDTILVVASAGEALVSSIGCTPSRPWDAEAQQFVAADSLSTPN